MPRFGIQFVVVVLLAALVVTTGWSQNTGPQKTSSSQSEPAVVTGVRVVHEQGVTVEVVSTHPVVPTIQTVSYTHLDVYKRQLPW